MTDNSIDATLTKAGASSRTASQHLEQVFEKEKERRRRRGQDEHRGKEETETAGTASDPHVVPPMQLPNPIQLVHRLSVLEGALTQLGHDCDTLAHQRKTIVQSVLTEQQQTTAKLFEILRSTTIEGSSSSSSGFQRENFRDDENTFNTLRRQLDLLSNSSS